MMESIRPRQSPFRSLDFFTRADAAVFSGREEEIEEVATRIMAGPTLVVYGPSGVGKTSLLCAGVLPALENRRGYRVTYVRPLLSPRGDVWRAAGADPDEPLAAALTRFPALASLDTGPVDADPAAASVTHAESDNGVNRDSSHLLRPTPHVLILDQLEELFTRFDEPNRRPLWDGLVEVLEDPSAPVRLVLSLREEYLHLLDSAHPRLPSLLDRRFRLRGLAPFGARTAIVRPLVAARIRYEPEFVERCVADLTEVPAGHGEEDGVIDPLLLQIVSSEAYREAEHRAPDAPSLTVVGYADLGGPAGVFRRHLDELFARAHVGDHLLLKLVLQEMTTAHATKLPTTVSRLSQSGFLAPAAELQGLLDKLVAASLVRKYDSEQEPWYELVHDRLVQALPQHFASDQQFLRLRYMRELVNQLSRGFSAGMAGAPLLNLQQLADLVEPFSKYIRFSEPELNLLFRSAVKNEHNVVMWRDAFEAVAPGKARAVLQEMLLYPDGRRGAVVAVGLLRITDPAHRARCLEIALHDSDPIMTAAASKTLSVVAGAEEAAKIVHALNHWSTRPRAVWLLADLAENVSVQAQLPPRALRMAMREAGRRQLLRHWDEIQRGGWQGLRIGMRSGVISGIVAIALWWLASAWFGDSVLVPYVIGISVVAVCSPLLGASCGYAAGRTMAKLQLEGRSPAWLVAAQDRFTLGPLTIPYILGALVTVLLLNYVAQQLKITQPDFSLVSIVLCAVAPAVVLGSIALIERTLPPVHWHHVHGPVAVAVRAFSLTWVFAIITGILLFLVSGIAPKQAQFIVTAVLVSASWYSICAASFSIVFNESIWKSSQARPSSLRRRLSLSPMIALVIMLVFLAWQTSLPGLAPIVEVSPRVVGLGDPQRPYRLEQSWMFGRWLRIRNSSKEPRILSSSPIDRSLQPEDLLLVWPGTHVRWFSSEATELYPLRQSDWRPTGLSPCTYVVVPLEKAGSRQLDLGNQADSIVVRHLRCRATYLDGSVKYQTIGQYGPFELDEPIGDLDGVRLRQSRYPIIDCDLQDMPKWISQIDAVLLIEPLKGVCPR